MNSMRFKTCTLIKNIGIRTRTLCKQSENGKTQYLKISTNYSSYNQTQYNQINNLHNEIRDLTNMIEQKERIIAQIYVDTFNKTNKTNKNISDVY
jgi:hypothetical protein